MDGQGGITLYKAGGDTAQRFDGQTQRRYIEQQNSGAGSCKIHISAGEDVALHRSALCHTFIRVDTAGGLHSGKLAHLILHRRNSCGAAHEKHLAQFACGDPGIIKGILHGTRRALHQITGQLIELSPVYAHFKMERTILAHREIGQADNCALRRGKFFFCLFRCFSDALHSRCVTTQVNTVLLLELSNQIVCNTIIKVIAAELIVSAGGENLDHAVTNLNNGNVKGSAAQIINHDLLGCTIIEPIR